jgi:hypothetical protein
MTLLLSSEGDLGSEVRAASATTSGETIFVFLNSRDDTGEQFPIVLPPSTSKA